jgi:hypothetical protein
MLLNNQFKFFNKEGNNINPDVRPNLVVSIVDPTGSGANAEARAITTADGKIAYVEILNGGVNYSANTYFEFIDLTIQNNVWTTEPSDVTITDGVITGFNLDEDNLNNNDFPYPASYVFDNYFLPVVSAGLIESENVFHGGAISPGIKMRFKALNAFTARLPLVHRDVLESHIGDTTLTSIQTGIQFGVVYEMKGFISKYRENYPDIRVLVTGGDATFFESQMENQIFAVPDLVLMGLNQILNYNVNINKAV